MNLSFPRLLDAQLFKATTIQDVAQTIELYTQGARLDVVFDLNYEISREHTTHFSLTALEAIFVGWDLDKLAQVVAGIGPLPDAILPNIRSALHAVARVRNEITRLDFTKDQRFLNNMRLMVEGSNLWGNAFVATTYWECIAHKDLNDKSLLERVVGDLSGNIPTLSDPQALERIYQMVQRASFTCGCLLFTKLGMDPPTYDNADYENLIKKSLEHQFEPRVSRVLIEQATEHNSASFARRKI